MQPDATPVCLMSDDFTHQGESALPNSLPSVCVCCVCGGGGGAPPWFCQQGAWGVLQKMKFILILTNLY